MQLVGLAAQRAQAARAPPARSAGLEKRWAPSASVWSAPSTSRPGCARGHCRGFLARQQARDRARRMRRGASLRARARRDRAGCTRAECRPLRAMPGAPRFSTRAPADRGRARAASVTTAMCRRRSASKRHHRRRGLLDRAAGHVDQRPVVPGAEPARGGDFLRHRLAVDILVVVALRLEAEQPVLADLHDPLGLANRPTTSGCLRRSTSAATARPAPAERWRS